MSHAEVGVKDDPIDAIVAAAQLVLIESAQPIRHGQQVTDTPSPVSNCPAGATFSQLRLRKSVDLFSQQTTHTINTGGMYRADELCVDPRDNLVMIANDAEVPYPFISIISTTS